jgi:DNA processing protein
MMSDNPYDIRGIRAALALLAATGNRDVHRLIAGLGVQGAYARLTQTPPLTQSLRQLLGNVPVDMLRTYTANARRDALRAGARIVIPEDDEWPSWLPDLAGADPQATDPQSINTAAAVCLWVRGNPRLVSLLHRSVAVTGSRAATAYGTTIAQEMGYALTAAGHTVVSTGGYGIDIAALAGALAFGGPTVAVAAGGVDRIHPQGNADLLRQVTDRGLIISAYPPGVAPTRDRFAATARLLAALTQASVLVEAGLRSRSLTVLEHSIALGRPAMAVPGPVTSAMSAGVHQALRDDPRIRLVRNTQDVLHELDRHRNRRASGGHPADLVAGLIQAVARPEAEEADSHGEATP